MAQSGSHRGGICIEEEEARASTKAETCMYIGSMPSDPALRLFPHLVQTQASVSEGLWAAVVCPGGEGGAERKPRISPSTVHGSISRQCPVIQKENLRVSAINPVSMGLALSYCQADDL